MDKIILNATHTHTGASYYETTQLSMSTPGQVPHPGVEIASSDEYREFLSTQAADAICEAYRRRAPGDLAFATNSFELYMDFMHRIQARSPFSQTFVVQLVGSPADASGYLCTERGARGKGCSASLYCNQVSPQGGQELVDETVRILKDIYTECGEPQ